MNANSRIGLIVVAACGFTAGYLASDRTSEVRVLRSRLTQTEDKLARRRDERGLAQVRADIPVRAQGSRPVTEDVKSAQSLITDEDIKAALEMNDRASHGEYILQFERPVDRKVMESGIRAFAAQLASNNVPKLANVFSQLGLAPEKAEQLELHNQKIILASLEAEQAIQQVLLARNEYDKRLRSLLPDDAYASYRQYEDSQPAVREYDSLQNYAAQNKFQLDPAYQQQVLGVIQQAQAYTCGWWHGPYDGLPPIRVGEEMVSQQLTEQVNQVNQAADQLKQYASAAGLPEQYLNLLNGYYAQIIQNKQQTIANLNTPQVPVASGK